MARQNPSAELTYTFLDFLGRTSKTTINIPTSLGAVGMASELTDAETLRTAIAGISGGTLIRQEFSPYVTKFSSSLTTVNTSIQRERRWIIVYEDNVNFERMELTVPCARVSDPANETIVDPDGFAILDTDQWDMFKTSFETIVRSKDKNPVTLLYAYITDDNL